MLWCESPCLGALRVGVGVGGVFCGWDVKSWWMDFSIFFKLGFAGVQTFFSIFLRLIIPSSNVICTMMVGLRLVLDAMYLLGWSPRLMHKEALR